MSTERIPTDLVRLSYRILPMRNPDRIAVDGWGDSSARGDISTLP